MKAKIFFFILLPLPSYRLKFVFNAQNSNHYDSLVMHLWDTHSISNEPEAKEPL